MQNVPRTGLGARFFWGLMFGLPAIFVLAGLGTIVAGFAQAPRDRAAAQHFRSDPSCAADLRATTGGGACTVVAAHLLTVDPATGGGQSVASGPSATLALADRGTVHISLAGNDGAMFARVVYPGTDARVQLFHGTIVRIAQGDVTAETTAAPDATASSDAQLPWVGVFVTVAGVVGWLVARRFKQRLSGVAY